MLRFLTYFKIFIYIFWIFFDNNRLRKSPRKILSTWIYENAEAAASCLRSWVPPVEHVLCFSERGVPRNQTRRSSRSPTVLRFRNVPLNLRKRCEFRLRGRAFGTVNAWPDSVKLNRERMSQAWSKPVGPYHGWISSGTRSVWILDLDSWWSVRLRSSRFNYYFYCNLGVFA